MYAPEGLKFSPWSLKPVWTCQTPVVVSHLNAVSSLLSKCLINSYAYRIGVLLKNTYSDILEHKWETFVLLENLAVGIPKFAVLQIKML